MFLEHIRMRVCTSTIVNLQDVACCNRMLQCRNRMLHVSQPDAACCNRMLHVATLVKAPEVTHVTGGLIGGAILAIDAQRLVMATD